MNAIKRSDLPLIWIRGAGDLATGVGVRLLNSGFRLAFSEIERPTVIRTTVSLAAAVYDGVSLVEGHQSVVCTSLEAVEEAFSSGQVPVYTGNEREALSYFKPAIFIEATIRKVKVDIPRDLVMRTIALGPGFSAPEDVDAVIETMRGHYLGRVIWKGEAIANTGVPGEIAGFAKERVIHAPAEGRVIGLSTIGDYVTKGQPIAYIQSDKEEAQTEVQASITGILRGMIREGLFVDAGMKIADIDPRCEKSHCYSISDKARSIGGGVLEAVMVLILKS